MTEGLLRFFKRSLDVGLVGTNNRDSQLNGLIEIMLLAYNENQVVLGEKMSGAQYSFGSLTDLLYSEWDAFKNNSYLKGISFNTYERLIDSFRINPCPREMSDQDYNALSKRKGYLGLAQFGKPPILKPYTYDYQSYNNWQADWYRNHPQEIEWTIENPFLPNLQYVEKVLEDELIKHKKYQYTAENGEESRVHRLAIAFHDKVMRVKGGQLKSYTKEIGSKICCGNAYTEEPKLSANESKANGGATRIIFSIVKNNKKQYISLDTAHGMFEFHDENGHHLGEFHFDGSMNSPADSTGKHDLKTIP